MMRATTRLDSFDCLSNDVRLGYTAEVQHSLMRTTAVQHVGFT
jgi:hypothetical protein